MALYRPEGLWYEAEVESVSTETSDLVLVRYSGYDESEGLDAKTELARPLESLHDPGQLDADLADAQARCV